ncbi:enolase C-terminal domain-like protein, partial [Candidatus Latescibacterota bacterium]
DLDGYAKLTRATEVRIAAGEQETSRYSFLDLMDRGQIDIVQVDVSRCGGLTEAMRIASLAKDRHRPVVNHSFTSGINLAASLHFTAALPNAFILEYCVSQSELHKSLTKQSFEVVDGIVKVPEEPGLGVELDIKTVERYHIE